MKNYERDRLVKLICVGIALAIVSLTACHQPLTVAPPTVVAHHASYEGNIANSGIITSDQYGFIVTKHFLDRHNISLQDATAVGNYWRIDAATMDKAVAADVAKRQPK